MSEANENKVNEEATVEAPAEEIVEVKEGKGKKIIKWVLTGVALVLAAVAGAIAGHAAGSHGDDDDTTEETTEE